jgi:predicted RNA-binding Zn-ribbon protein involved in translation (DUF1610 family)
MTSRLEDIVDDMLLLIHVERRSTRSSTKGTYTDGTPIIPRRGRVRPRAVVWKCPACQISLPAVSAPRRLRLGIFACPECGATLTYNADDRVVQRCGTLPFEVSSPKNEANPSAPVELPTERKEVEGNDVPF